MIAHLAVAPHNVLTQILGLAGRRQRRASSASSQQALLAHWSTHRFALRLGTRIVCQRGQLWITADGCARDVVLAAGESWAVDSASRILVTGFQPEGSAYRVLKSS